MSKMKSLDPLYEKPAKEKFEQINYTELKKLIAADCGYHLYEIEDVLASLRAVVTEAISQHKQVKYEHFCWFVPKINKPKKLCSILISGNEMKTKGSLAVKFKPAKYLTDSLNNPTMEDEGTNYD